MHNCTRSACKNFQPLFFPSRPFKAHFRAKNELLRGSIDLFTIKNDAKVSHSKTRLVLQLGEEGRSRVVQTQYLLVLELAKKGTPGTHPPPKSATDAHSKEFRPKMLCAQPWYVLNHQFEIQFFFSAYMYVGNTIPYRRI